MPVVFRSNQPFASAITPRYTDLLDSCWPAVRVEAAELTRHADGCRCARAVVQLGGLRPADVRVELIPVADERGGAASVPEYRLFSNQSYDNGSFVFEGTLPSPGVERVQHWVLHVHPAEAVEEQKVEYHFSAGTPAAPCSHS